MSSLLKKLGILAVSSAITLSSYGYAIAGEKKKTHAFYNFNRIDISSSHDGMGVGFRVTTVATADVDGDGDQDIIVGIEGYNQAIYIIENKMPQKNKEAPKK